MKKFLSLVFLFLFTEAAFGYTQPPNPCYEGCTPYMKNLVKDFTDLGTLPNAQPQVYSGECHHLGLYNPEQVHYAVVFLDQTNKGWNFSTIFSFFAESNEYAKWTTEVARQEMSPYWQEHGQITTEENTARAEALDSQGVAIYNYWMRQHPITNELLYITYAGIAMKSFCRLQPN